MISKKRMSEAMREIAKRGVKKRHDEMTEQERFDYYSKLRKGKRKAAVSVAK